MIQLFWNSYQLQHMESTEMIFVSNEHHIALTAGFTDGSNDPVNYILVENHPNKAGWWLCILNFKHRKEGRLGSHEKAQVPSYRQILGYI